MKLRSSPPLSARHLRFQARTLELMVDFGIRGYVFHWNKRKKQFGRCIYPFNGAQGRIELSWYFVKLGADADIEDTIRHEIAHVLAGPDANHGPEWVKMCRVTGAMPNRCSEKPMPKGKWQCSCPNCSKEYDRHRKPKRLFGWYCAICGPTLGPLRWTKLFT